MPTNILAFARSKPVNFPLCLLPTVVFAWLALVPTSCISRTVGMANVAVAPGDSMKRLETSPRPDDIQRKLDEGNERFRYDGKPITPGVLMDFGVFDLGERMHIAVAVDLERATDDYYQVKRTTETNRGIESIIGDGDNQEVIGYRHLGRLANGWQ